MLVGGVGMEMWCISGVGLEGVVVYNFMSMFTQMVLP